MPKSDSETPKDGPNQPKHEPPEEKPESSESTTTTSPSDAAEAYRREIIDLIHTISAGTRRTDVRTIVDRYPGLVNPRLVEDGESRFPVSMARHRTAGRSTHRRRLSLLAYHIGDAVTAYYGFVNDPGPENQTLLSVCIAHLRMLAKTGYDGTQVVGSDEKGYALVPQGGAAC